MDRGVVPLGTHFLISREKLPHRYRRAGGSHRHAASEQNAGSDPRDRSPADHHRACSPFPFARALSATLASRRQVRSHVQVTDAIAARCDRCQNNR